MEQLTYKAVVIQETGKAALEEIPIPAIRENEVAIQVAYVGVCKTDLEILNGSLGYYQNQIAKYPIVPGHEVSGTVTAIGQNVNHLKIGDSVVVECIQGCGLCYSCQAERPIGCDLRTELGVIGRNGGYSELMIVPARFVQPIPPALDIKTTCLSEPLAVVIKGLHRLNGAWGETPKTKNCAVVGAGPIGRLCALVLTHRGHFVTLFDQDLRRLKDVESNIETSPTLDNLDRFDAIIEATGEQSALKIVIEKSRAGAALLLLGLPYGFENFSFEQIVAYDKTIVGSVGSSSSDFTEALLLLPKLDISALVKNVLPLADFQKAWEAVRTRSELKILLSPNGSSMQ
jgi:2-desacetyl-2-hydroxyethyl bacteriochlorophyllide A dehydrogenase